METNLAGNIDDGLPLRHVDSLGLKEKKFHDKVEKLMKMQKLLIYNFSMNENQMIIIPGGIMLELEEDRIIKKTKINYTTLF